MSACGFTKSRSYLANERMTLYNGAVCLKKFDRFRCCVVKKLFEVAIQLNFFRRFNHFHFGRGKGTNPCLFKMEMEKIKRKTVRSENGHCSLFHFNLFEMDFLLCVMVKRNVLQTINSNFTQL